MEHNTLFRSAARLTDAELRCQVVLLASREREATAELIGHLAEFAARKLYLADGYGSLFAIARRRFDSPSTPPTTASKPLS